MSFQRFENKIIIQKRFAGQGPQASPSALLSLDDLPKEVPVVVAPNLSTGENLPQGTGYINLSLSPATKKLRYFFYEASPDAQSSASAGIFVFHGDFIIKKLQHTIFHLQPDFKVNGQEHLRLSRKIFCLAQVMVR